MSYTKTIQSIVIIAFGVLFISQAQAVPIKANYENAANCKRTLFTKKVAIHENLGRATAAAISVWQNRVKARFGSAYAKWSRAIKRKRVCTRNPRTNTFHCRVNARPCRLPVFKR